MDLGPSGGFVGGRLMSRCRMELRRGRKQRLKGAVSETSRLITKELSPGDLVRLREALREARRGAGWTLVRVLPTRAPAPAPHPDEGRTQGSEPARQGGPGPSRALPWDPGLRRSWTRRVVPIWSLGGAPANRCWAEISQTHPRRSPGEAMEDHLLLRGQRLSSEGCGKGGAEGCPRLHPQGGWRCRRALPSYPRNGRRHLVRDGRHVQGGGLQEGSGLR